MLSISFGDVALINDENVFLVVFVFLLEVLGLYC